MSDGPEPKRPEIVSIGSEIVNPNHNGKMVLVAEDHELIRGLIVGALRKDGYHVMSVPDGATLIETREKLGNNVRLMVMDVLLPGRNGLECLAQMRAAGVDTPVIVATGSVEPGIEERIDSRSRLLRKPFRMSDLSSLAASLIAGDACAPPS